MIRRRIFVPGAVSSSSLETRLAPGGGFLGLGKFFDTVGHDLGINKHHSSTNAAAGIQQLWAESAVLSRPTHPAVAKHK